MTTHQQAANRVERGFWIHAAAYVAVVGGLAFLNYSRNPDNHWFLWVAGGWGIGLAAQAFAMSVPGRREALVERTEARMQRREDRQERRENRAAARQRDL